MNPKKLFLMIFFFLKNLLTEARLDDPSAIKTTSNETLLSQYLNPIQQTTVLPKSSADLTPLVTPEPLKIFCDNMTDQFIGLSGQSLKKITQGTFEKCKKVSEVDLSRNELTSLTDNMFEFNTYLETLNLSCNLLTSIDPKWFLSCSAKMGTLDVSNNRLTYLTEEKLPTMTNLKFLMIEHNLIHDIDEVQIITKFDSLKHFKFQFNQIGCVRQNHLISYFGKQGINTSINTGELAHMTPTICIDDGEWASLNLVYLQKSLKDDIKNVRDTSNQQSIHDIALSIWYFSYISIGGYHHRKCMVETEDEA